MLAALLLALAAGCGTSVHRPCHRDAPLSTSVQREQFRELLVSALQREALYTLVGGLKPLSTGFWQGKIRINAPDTAEIARVRRVLAPLRDETFYADVQTFAAEHDGQRHVEAYVVHRPALAAMLRRESAFWYPLGVTPCTHPAEIVAIVDRLPRADRWRAYGLLFGYPRYAVEFFVEATELARAGGGESGPGKDREFYHIPTASSAESQFTWAVPLGHQERVEDRAIRQRAGEILAAYQKVSSQIADAGDPMPILRTLNSSLAGLCDHAATQLPHQPSQHDSRRGRLAGLWFVERVEVFVTASVSSLPPAHAASLAASRSRTDCTNKLLRERMLTILYTINADRAYAHTLKWSDAPERSCHEAGSRTIDGAGVIRCFNSTDGASSFPEARALYIEDSPLIARMNFTGSVDGQSEIVRHRRQTWSVRSSSVESPGRTFQREK